MKIIYLLLVGLSLSLLSYNQVYTPKKENGWYQIIDGQQGKRIGLILNDTVITAPQINARIESGHFQISNPYGYDLKRIYLQLLREKANSTGNLSEYCCHEQKLDTAEYKIMEENLLMNEERNKKENSIDSISVSPNQPDSKLLWEEAHQYRATITDSTFLSTKGIMSDKAIAPLVSGGWNKNYAYNQVVYLKALERAKRHLSVKDNKFSYPLKSGKEINISEDLHQYICRLFEDWNCWVADGRCKIAKDENGFYDIIPYK